MNKSIRKLHLKSSMELLKKRIKVLVAEVEEMKPTVNINNVGLFVKKELEIMELTDKIERIEKELEG